MNWIKMSFKGQLVLVHADDSGRPVLDGEGRAEMKYRETDSRVYRPALVNLGAAGAGAKSQGNNASNAHQSASEPKPVKRKPAPPKRPAPGPASTATQHVWTDGACTGNPGPMGIGVVVMWDDDRRELSEFLGQGTNNIAELVAIERGLDLAEEAAPDRDRPIRVYTDSAYSIGVLSMGWKAKANQELVGRIRERLTDFVDVTFVKVAGHAGVPENERCDELARLAITTRGRA